MDAVDKGILYGFVFGFIITLVVVALVAFSLVDEDEVILGGERFVRVDAEQEDVVGFGCLTSLDLNRDDLRDVVILSNPCFQFGWSSILYLQEDEQGNQFGVPVCVRGVDS